MRKNLEILIVEDESITAMWLQLYLTREGYQVCGVLETGEETLTFLQERVPDLILMDIKLAGGLDGIETVEEFKSNHAIPIIFMSGYSDEVMIRRARQVGCLGYLIKPFDMLELEKILQTVD